MHNAAWQALLRHIPADQQNGYMVVTTARVEIAVQDFLRIEDEMLVFRGRLSGSQDQGLLFFLPYARIEYIGTMKAVKETDVAEVFGSFTFPQPVAPVPDPPVQPSVAEKPPSVLDLPLISVKPERSASKSGIRSEVLDRYRNRANSSINLPSPPLNP